MISIDTNVLVRFLVRDDAEQFQKAVSLFNSTEIYIPDTVFLETEWVLRFAYGYNVCAVSKAFRDLLGLSQVHVADVVCLRSAVEWHADGLDFADALHLSCSQDIDTLATFDKAFARRSDNLGRCRVVDLA
ncbi:MAG: type II toxin-antitoxin system VapC family toxin [Lentisphaerae bacterium]|nr:type II toxin-antitoxin system VapC family toxin [Lentisphaerota bacterium]